MRQQNNIVIIRIVHYLEINILNQIAILSYQIDNNDKYIMSVHRFPVAFSIVSKRMQNKVICNFVRQRRNY